ncbi:MAG TPA: hypothetical protein PK264_18085 [Hyphomicrobiaceae bacterium]|nr:hypothetical protein [Hyphomicrobiaceae bacterium]
MANPPASGSAANGSITPADGEQGRPPLGTCCSTMADAIGSPDFEPLISIGDDDGVLYISVGLVNTEDTKPGLVEFPLLFCPFCGTAVQTDSEIEQRTGHAPGTSTAGT